MTASAEQSRGPTAQPPDDLAATWAGAADELARDARLPGLAIGVHRGGNLIWFHGAADTAAGQPPTAATVFRIASITKLFTAAAVLLAQQDRRLSIDDAVAQYVPTFPSRTVTIRELLVHASGLQRETPGDSGWHTGHFLIGEALHASIKDAMQVQPALTRWKYSNLGYNVLGEMMAVATGEPFAGYVKTHLIDPLDLVDTTFDRSAIRQDALAAGHRRSANGGWEPDPFDDLPVPGPAGGLYSSVRDLARFGALLTGDIPGPLSDSSLQSMRQPVLAVETSEITQAQAIGPLVLKGPCGSRLGHAGGLFGYASWFLASTTTGLGCVALTNVGDGDGLFEICSGTLDVAEQTLQPVARDAPTEATSAALSLAGRYWGDGTIIVLTWAASGLAAHWETARGGASRPMRLTLLGPNRVRADEGPYVGEEAIFDTDAAGRVTGFQISTYRYVKIQ